jgi:N-acetylated-alpha-linked acidic dipeptidase
MFVSVPDASSARDNLKYITSKPHMAGTDGDLEMATYVYDQFVLAGLTDVQFWNLTVGLNYPTDRPTLSLINPDEDGAVVFEAALSEDILSEDSTSDTYWRNHTFNGYSPSGDVTASAVYANYGRPEDFDYLEANGIDVEGKIVIMRYGQCFRGLKAMNAESRGAVGTIIYSDPEDDGYGLGDVYPEGPWRPASAVQRGTAVFTSLCGGDPYRADPRYGDDYDINAQNVCSFTPDEILPTKPVLPISYGDAGPILAQLGGQDAPVDFIGGINGLTYTLGPSDLQLHLTTATETTFGTIWNVVATIEGSQANDDEGDQDMPVLLGNHRDAWVYGAADPNSGTASLIEVARGFGYLMNELSWKPHKTIKLLSWSGEEQALMGSTGYAELNADEISWSTVYLNTDITISGDYLEVYATPALSTVWKSVLTDLNEEIEPSDGLLDNSENNKFRKTHLGVEIKNGPYGDVYDTNSNRILSSSMERQSVGTLGSGSDYAAYLDHYGIASMDFMFSPGDVQGNNHIYGVYHSDYDSFDWMDAWGGNGTQGSAFYYMAAAARVWGVLAMRLSTNEFAPFDHFETSEALFGYLAHIEKVKLDGMDLSNLWNATQQFAKAAKQIEKDIQMCDYSQQSINSLNIRLTQTERQFLLNDGLPGRPWFKHVLQAPGLYLGYTAESYPGIQQAIDDNDLTTAQEQVEAAAGAVNAAAFFLSNGVDGKIG